MELKDILWFFINNTMLEKLGYINSWFIKGLTTVLGSILEHNSILLKQLWPIPMFDSNSSFSVRTSSLLPFTKWLNQFKVSNETTQSKLDIQEHSNNKWTTKTNPHVQHQQWKHSPFLSKAVFLKWDILWSSAGGTYKYKRAELKNIV